jgi:hypothetical protein
VRVRVRVNKKLHRSLNRIQLLSTLPEPRNQDISNKKRVRMRVRVREGEDEDESEKRE